MLTTLTARKFVLTIFLFSFISVVVLAIFFLSDKISNSVRSYVRAEGLWAKAQNEAVLQLSGYLYFQDPVDYTAFREALAVNLGDTRARLALKQEKPDRVEARAGFLQAQNHPDDIGDMIWFFLYFQQISYMRDAIQIWTDADGDIGRLIALGEEIHDAVSAGTLSPEAVQAFRIRLDYLDKVLHRHEIRFSETLSEGARWVRMVVWSGAAGLVLLFFGIGFAISRQILLSIVGAEEELVESEHKYRQILEEMDDTYYRTDASGTLIMTSPSVVDLLGYTPEEIRGRPLADLYRNPRQREKFLQRLWKSGGRTTGDTACLRHKKGHHVWVSTSAHFLFDRSGEVAGVEGISRNITERLKLERELAESKKATEKANEAKSQFLANMSHELRTPLNAILGFSETINAEVFGPVENKRYKDYIRHIHESSRHLLELINDILDLSKVEANAMTLDEENVRIQDVVDAVFLLLMGRAREGGVVLVNSIQNIELPEVFADQRRLKQIFLNLLSNAIKFTPATGKVEVSGVVSDIGEIVITVRDTGIGMTEDELEVALSEFGQVVSDASLHHAGTGLGLPLTKRLVELHGGTFDIQSKKGQGTVIEFTLPSERVR